MNKNMTTLGRVSDRVNDLSMNCYDNLVRVEDISWANYQIMSGEKRRNG